MRVQDLTLLLVLAEVSGGGAAQAPPIRSGDRIRVAVLGVAGRYAGTAGMVGPDGLRFTPDRGTEMTIAWPTVTRLWASRGTGSATIREALIGAAVFSGLALTYGTVVNLAGCFRRGGWVVCPRGWDNVAAGVLLWGGLGAVGGAVRGARRTVERWEEIRPPAVRLAPVVAPSRAGISVAITF